MKDKIIDKIRKLFALATNNSNKHESESAMIAAKKMLDKHQLSMSDLNEKEKIGIIIKNEKNMPYVRIIFKSICKLYSCDYLLSKNSNKTTHLIIGAENNRITAEIVSDFVIDSIRKRYIGYGNAFRNSAAQGVLIQVDEILAERLLNKEEQIPGTGLILADLDKLMKDEIDKFNKLHFGKIKNKATYSVKNKKAESFGKNINLGAHLGQKNKTLN